MKAIFLGMIVFVFSGWTWGQAVNGTAPPNMGGHPQKAVTQVLSTGGGMTVEHGEQKSNFVSPPEALSLGEVARRLKAEHETAPKATKCWVSQ